MLVCPVCRAEVRGPVCGRCGTASAEGAIDATMPAPAGAPALRPRGSHWEEVTFMRPSEVADATTDRHFGRYVRIEVLGEGSFGEVWRAWDKVLERWIALKLLKRATADETRSFIREAKTIARLRHRNIAEAYDAGDVDGRAFIAMQLVRGDTLAKKFAGDVAETVALLRDAAFAVHYAHEQGFVHRDLKPANLMYERAGDTTTVFVMDFGLARWLPAGSSGAGGGTALYMAPEQASGEPVDRRADVYALAATLYHVVSGRPHVNVAPDDDLFSVLAKIRRAEFVPLREAKPDLDGELVTIVHRALEPDREARTQNASELGSALDDWLGRQSSARRRRRARPTHPGDAAGRLHADALVADRYVLRGMLGQGGFGSVWSARDLNLETDVAIKFQNTNLEHEWVARLAARGLEIQARILHPVIVPIRDTGEHEGHTFFVMPRIEGSSVEQLVQGTRPAPAVTRQLIGFVRDVALAADELHARGYHRFDIKPGNLIVATGHAHQHILWTDFDLAIAERDPPEGHLAGTPVVMAPEQWRSERGDRRTDVYALGATLSYVASGAYPITGDVTELMARARDGTLEAKVELDEVDRDLARIIARCLRADPRDRFATAADLARALEAYLAHLDAQLD